MEKHRKGHETHMAHKNEEKQGQTNITWETKQTADIQNDRMWMTKTRICYYQSTNALQAGLASYHDVTNVVLSFWSWVAILDCCFFL